MLGRYVQCEGQPRSRFISDKSGPADSKVPEGNEVKLPNVAVRAQRIERGCF